MTALYAKYNAVKTIYVKHVLKNLQRGIGVEIKDVWDPVCIMHHMHRKHYYIYIYSANITAMQLCLYILPLFGPIMSLSLSSP